MTQDELDIHLGVGEMRTIVVDGRMIPSPCPAGPDSLSEIGEELATEIMIEFGSLSLLGICLGHVSIPSTERSYDVYLPAPMEIVVATPNGPDATDMVICPQSGSRDKIGPGRFSLPMFEVEYHIGDVDPDVIFSSLCESMDMLMVRFETDILLDLLSKSVRSQRNRIDAPLSSESISEAMELIERESRSVTHCVLNTRAHAALRERIQDGMLFGAEVLRCSPRKRQDIKRNYFLGPSEMLGVFASCEPVIEIAPPDITMTMRIGAAILDRSLISSVDGPL